MFAKNKKADPVLKAFGHEDAKAIPAQVNVGTLAEFIDKCADSVTNQTSDIGSAYNLAHLAMCLAEMRNKETAVLVAQSFFLGIYEEQLAGLSAKYRRLFGTLAEEEEFVADLRDGEYISHALFKARVIECLTDVGHTELAAKQVIRVWEHMMSARFVINRSKRPRYITGLELIEAVIARLYRAIGTGAVETKSGKTTLNKALAEARKGISLTVKDGGNDETKDIIDWARDYAARGSFVAQQVVEFFDDILPWLPLPEESDED